MAGLASGARRWTDTQRHALVASATFPTGPAALPMRHPQTGTPYSCMSAAELVAWQAANATVSGYHGRARSPCRDCDPAWRREQVATGRCTVAGPTPRELETLKPISSRGANRKNAADEPGLSDNTVKAHLRRPY